MRRILGYLLLVILTGCSATPTSAPPPKVDTAALVEGNTQFALRLFARFDDGKNCFFSPYSLSSALAMTYAGARGDTAMQMKDVLAFPSDDKLHAAFRTLAWELTGDPGRKSGYQLSIANRLWGKKGYPWNKEFLDASRTYYGAGLEEVEFSNPEPARKTINDWVETQTQKRIKDLIPEGILTPDSRMVLTNAIYFKGDWASQFKKDRTQQDGTFHLGDEKTATLPLMSQTGQFDYSEDPTAQVVRLPYVGKELELVVILPWKNDGLAEVEKNLTPAQLKGWVERARPRRVVLTLPKFKVESSFILNKALEDLGMKNAFSDTLADFTGLATREKLFLGAVIHKAFVEVSEEGTEAAAATAVVVAMKDGPARGPEEIRFRADHPFVFLIRDVASGSVLFLGRFAGR